MPRPGAAEGSRAASSRSAGLAGRRAGPRDRARSRRAVCRHGRVRPRVRGRAIVRATAGAPAADAVRALAGAVLAGGGRTARAGAGGVAAVEIADDDDSTLGRIHHALSAILRRTAELPPSTVRRLARRHGPAAGLAQSINRARGFRAMRHAYAAVGSMSACRTSSPRAASPGRLATARSEGLGLSR